MQHKLVPELCLSIKEGIEHFLLDLEISNRSHSTVKVNRCTLGYMAGFAERNNWPGLNGVGKLHLSRYMAYLKGRPRWFGERDVDPRPISDSYYETNYRRLKRFFGWCVEQDYMDENPMAGMAHPKVGTKVIPLVDDIDFRNMMTLLDPSQFSTPARRFRAIRDQAVLWLFADTPGRREEVSRLRVKDVDLDRTRVFVLGKGRKERYMPLGSITVRALRRYKAARDALEPDTDSWWVDAQGHGMRPDWIYQMIKRLALRAGVPELHPHRFRHTFAIKTMQAQVPLPILEVMGGWSRIPKTYLVHLDDDIVKESHRRVSPADRLAGLRRD